MNNSALLAFPSYRWNFPAMQGDSITLFMSPFKWFKNETFIEMHTEASFTVYILKINNNNKKKTKAERKQMTALL